MGTGLREDALPPLLELARRSTEAHNQRLIWYTPTQYCHFDPVQLELGVKGCTAALVQHVRRAGWQRDPLPVLLPLTGQPARQTTGTGSGTTRWLYPCASAATCRKNAMPAPCWQNAAADAR